MGAVARDPFVSEGSLITAGKRGKKKTKLDCELNKFFKPTAEFETLLRNAREKTKGLVGSDGEEETRKLPKKHLKK